MTRFFKPSVTVAAVISRDFDGVQKFLLVEEETRDGLKLNNPAGHLDPGESPAQGSARETLEETAFHFTPTAIIGVYLSRFERAAMELESLNLASASPAVRENHRQLTGYFRSNLHRMDYPQYVANGWQIGSGKVESACKSVVAGRLKGPGMRWREYGTTALCQLRALHKSQPGCWQHYWNSITAA